MKNTSIGVAFWKNIGTSFVSIGQGCLEVGLVLLCLIVAAATIIGVPILLLWLIANAIVEFGIVLGLILIVVGALLLTVLIKAIVVTVKQRSV